MCLSGCARIRCITDMVYIVGLDTSEPNAVVIGLAPEHFNYQTLNKAFR